MMQDIYRAQHTASDSDSPILPNRLLTPVTIVRSSVVKRARGIQSKHAAPSRCEDMGKSSLSLKTILASVNRLYDF